MGNDLMLHVHEDIEDAAKFYNIPLAFWDSSSYYVLQEDRCVFVGSASGVQKFVDANGGKYCKSAFPLEKRLYSENLGNVQSGKKDAGQAALSLHLFLKNNRRFYYNNLTTKLRKDSGYIFSNFLLRALQDNGIISADTSSDTHTLDREFIVISEVDRSTCLQIITLYFNRFKQQEHLKAVRLSWNLDYLKNEILPQREKEIEEGKNAMTRQPIYVVLDLQEHCISGHEQDYSLHTNLKGVQPKFGYTYQNNDGEWVFSLEDQHCVTDEVTIFYTDRIVAFFFTRKGAEEYLEYQKHNLTENAYIYTFYSGYANQEMDKLLNGQ